MRPTVDAALMAIASVWEDRSTCSRNHVGAVIAKGGRLIGSGYNGAPAGMAHCEHETVQTHFNPTFGTMPGSPVDRGCQVSVHAEANAISYCARFGIATAEATLYTTLSPCYACSQLIISAGLARVVYGRNYRDPEGTRLLVMAGIVVEKAA